MGDNADFSYGGDLSKPLDLVRFALGDTTSPGLFTNTTIRTLLALQPAPNFAAAALAEARAAQLLSQPRVRIGATEVDPAQNAKYWTDLATRLRSGGMSAIPGGSVAPPGGLLVGGLSRAGNLTLNTNCNVQPTFRIGQDDLRGGAYTTGIYDDEDRTGR